MSSNSALNRRSFLVRGAALAAVPAVASLAAEALTGRASAGTLPDYAPIHHGPPDLPQPHDLGRVATGTAFPRHRPDRHRPGRTP